MPLNKVKPGSNMYQWVTHTHNHLAGACPHACVYCSTQDMARRFLVMRERYSGPPRLIEKEFSVDYGKRWRPDKDSPWRTEKTIFVENCSDLFAEGIPSEWIHRVLFHCKKYPENTYVFQTKNPGRIPFIVAGFEEAFSIFFPLNFLIGTTAESNFDEPERTKAPAVNERLRAIFLLDLPYNRKFVTVEPIQAFSLRGFLPLLLAADAGTYYIGADSKNHGLPEPTSAEIKALVEGLREAGKKVVLKSNLKRLYRGE